MNKKRAVGIRDLFNLRIVSEPQISPDGERIAFVHTMIDYEEDEYISDIWMADAKTGASVQFTSGRVRTKTHAGRPTVSGFSSPRRLQ